MSAAQQQQQEEQGRLFEAQLQQVQGLSAAVAGQGRRPLVSVSAGLGAVEALRGEFEVNSGNENVI